MTTDLFFLVFQKGYEKFVNISITNCRIDTIESNFLELDLPDKYSTQKNSFISAYFIFLNNVYV